MGKQSQRASTRHKKKRAVPSKTKLTKKRKENTPPNIEPAAKKVKADDSLELEVSKKRKENGVLSECKSDAGMDESVSEPSSSSSSTSASTSKTFCLKDIERALNTTEIPDEIKCRENEQATINKFIESCLEKRRGGSLYVCGSPGTGKSAIIQTFRKQLEARRRQKNSPISRVVYFNTNVLRSANQVYPRIYNEVSGSDEATNKKKNITPLAAAEKLQGIFLKKKNTKKGMNVVILDEIDGLLTSNQAVLYRLFEWAFQVDGKRSMVSNLILIGIANTIDLTHRFLPRLKSRGCEPELLVFSSYDRTQLSMIVEQRLRDCAKNQGAEDLPFEKSAIELCARKVSSMSGDVRKCLEVCRKSLQLVLDRGDDCKQVTFDDVSEVISSVFGSPFVNIIKSLPQHQKTALCIAVLLFRCGGKKSTVGQYHDVYSRSSRKMNFPPASSGEFGDIILALASHGLLSIKSGKGKKSKDLRMRSVELIVQDDDVDFALQDNSFFKNILKSQRDVNIKY